MVHNTFDMGHIKRKILLVDNESSCMDNLPRKLSQHQSMWDVQCSPTVESALALLNNHEYDVILAGLGMAVQDGFGLLENMDASLLARTPVIVITEPDNYHLKSCILNMGASDLMVRPVVLDDLAARIMSLLRLHDYRTNLESDIKRLEREVAEKKRELDRTRLEVVLRLAHAAEARDYETGDHILRVGYCSKILASYIGESKDFTRSIFLSSPLHDIGKIGVPDHVLRKKGAFNSHEQIIMRQHCIIGSKLLLKRMTDNIDLSLRQYFPTDTLHRIENPVLEMAASIALTHHERWDGSGYPLGLKGTDIPVESRIVAICDVYDAMIHNRIYKPAYDEEIVLRYLRSGNKFDPEMVGQFEQVLPDIRLVEKDYIDGTVPN